MRRQLCVFALAALVLVPDWVSACWPRWVGPAYDPVPVYYAPPPVYCQPVYVVPCVPVAPPVLPLPRIEPSKPRSGSTTETPARPPRVEAVRPAAAVETPKVVKPDPAPAPLTPEQKIPPVEIPKFAPEAKLPPIELPKVEPGPKLPPIELPKSTDPELPPIEFPANDKEPKLPPLELPKTDTPKPIELPKADARPKLPPIELPKADVLPKPSGLEFPGVPAVPVPAPAPDALPPLTLPPDTPVAPDAKPVESKSSPLTTAREVKVSVFAASGTAAGRGLRTVGFFNHTDRDLSLTIEGKAVKLPAKTYLHAQLPPAFTWAHGDKPAAKETVPADASGVDVLFK